MFLYRARTHNSPAFKKVFETVKDLSSHPVLKLSAERAFFQGMDAAHVLMALFELGADFFQEIDCPSEVTISFKTATLCKILRFCDDGDIITLSVEPTADALLLEFDSGPAAPYERHATFRLPLLMQDTEMLTVPQRSYEAEIRMLSAPFFALARSLLETTAAATFVARVKPCRFLISYEGKSGTGEVEFAEGDGTAQSVQLRIACAVEKQFSLALINSMTRAAALSDTIGINFAADAPLMLSFELGPGSFFQVYVAPKAAGE